MGKRKSKQSKQVAKPHPLQETLGVRLSEYQRQRLQKARDVVAARKGERVEESVLAREFIMRGCDEVLGAAAIAGDERRIGVPERRLAEPAPTGA